MEEASATGITIEEVQLAARNHGLPLEALRYPITPLGLHYLLIHFDIPEVDVATWQLSLGGLVERAASFTLDEIAARPAVTLAVTLECAGNGRALLTPHVASQPWLHEAVGTAEWTGTPLAPLLREAGPGPDASAVVFTGLDRGLESGVEHLYERSLPLEEALREEVLLAYAVNGERLPPQHGYPLRLIVPGWYGMTAVKWLRTITVIDEEFRGWQQEMRYRLQRSEDEPGEPVTRMLPRSLLVPPGIPDFFARERFVEAGRCVLEGRAWSGWAAVERIEVTVDGGLSWDDATLGEAVSPYGWSDWRFEWDATPGEYELACRATDAAGNTQPTEAEWNLGGYCNNVVQRVRVIVS